MSDSANIAIKVENLGKKYVINHDRGRGDESFREIVVEQAKKLVSTINPFAPNDTRTSNRTYEDFWALEDLNFEIGQGDKVGIIGRNGAGKSTLLKVLSRITEPSRGRIDINGRIATLLEVGTGFHPDLTGRENIYLNGAILGMSRKEIKTKFDEIVAFAEVEQFLDTPVKRYSSGMYVRLAFSVAAHLESEILVIDEVLAVGDVEFQKKCLGKMGEVSEEGRTVLFVSHNMNAIEQLCDHAILMDKGKLLKVSNNVREVIHDYLSYNENNTSQSEWINQTDQFKDSNFQLFYAAVLDEENRVPTKPVKNDTDITIILEGKVEALDAALQVGYALFNEDNSLLFWSIFNDADEKDWPKVRKGVNRFSSRIPRRFLNEGTYRVEMIVALYYRYWVIEPQKNSPSIFFTIQGGLSDSPYWMVRRPGILAPEFTWSVD